MAEDISTKIDAEWEKLQYASLQIAGRIILAARRPGEISEAETKHIATLPPVTGQVIAAVIGTFSPAPLGVDDFIGALAVANANAADDEPDAVKSPPVFAGKG